jgi:hypothetical protein
MECRHNRHLQFAQKVKNVAACNSTIDAVLVLKANEIVAVEVEKLRSPLVGNRIFLFQLQAYPLRVA